MTEPSLRARTLDVYLSSTSGAHVPLEAPQRRRYMHVYARYLRSWLPTNRCRWVDLGAGQGALLNLARELGYAQVEGVDASGECVAVCRQQRLNVTLGDAVDYVSRLPARSCAVISCFDLIEHMSKDSGFALLKGCRHALADDGVCLLKLPNADSPWGFSVTAGDLTHDVAYNPASLRQLAYLAGFQSFQARELAPQAASWRGAVRAVAWQMVRRGVQAINAIETGNPGGGIYTRVFLARLAVEDAEQQPL